MVLLTETNPFLINKESSFRKVQIMFDLYTEISPVEIFKLKYIVIIKSEAFRWNGKVYTDYLVLEAFNRT